MKYSPHGSEIHVELMRTGDHARWCVRDQGIGIAPEELDRLFELVRRAQKAASCPVPGLGIGLATVRQIVQRHGGQVQASYAGDGRGATFTVELPFVKPASRCTQHSLFDVLLRRKSDSASSLYA